MCNVSFYLPYLDFRNATLYVHLFPYALLLNVFSMNVPVNAADLKMFFVDVLFEKKHENLLDRL